MFLFVYFEIYEHDENEHIIDTLSQFHIEFQRRHTLRTVLLKDHFDHETTS